MNLIRINNWTVEFVNPTFNLVEVREAWHNDAVIPLPLPKLFKEGCTGDEFLELMKVLEKTDNNKIAQWRLLDLLAATPR